jgi:hypothetical protein
MNETKGFFIVASVRPLDRTIGSDCYIGRLFRKLDGFVKSPISALRFIPQSLRRTLSTPHSAGFARLELGLFTKPSIRMTFYESINLDGFVGSATSALHLRPSRLNRHFLRVHQIPYAPPGAQDVPSKGRYP